MTSPQSEQDGATAPLRIDIVSDVVCPWCVVGYRQLSEALTNTGTPHEVFWHPFELNPDMAADGQNMREHIAEKYGSTPEQSQENRDRLTAIGADLGITFRFSEEMRMHNTFNTHQLLHWADQFGRKNDLKQALFTAHFTDQRSLSDIAVLAEIAAEIGLDRDEALTVLKDQRFAQEVRTAETFWLQQGIRGVPAMVFDRQHLVTGAQGVDTYTDILKQLAQGTA
ncbi:DsbA family protein [Pseudoruegeria sp. SK021]|uniref:DsbA family oxidoreductase n=1 Tax=Pseudoruegeria sp. SK021 TaxID=1933035 RepID=UPI000A22BE9E|nr:DsbA family oxidoreductase [Pseudoruegeria sp. SK021]OSP53567.1 disulfide bond formation protein DsbA [Pseudoruegeria sp. SK021]